jgi:Flp pilus assembly protein protease CpaA
MEVKNAYPLLLLFLSIIQVIINRPDLGLLILNTLLVFAVLYTFWHFKGMGGADVKTLTALSVGAWIDIWWIILFSCFVFIVYALILRKPRQALPFVPAIFVGAAIELIFNFGGSLG